MKRKIVTLSTALLFFLSSYTLAVAVTAPVIQSGQDKCYLADGTETACAATGQDGELKPGAAWPTPRFTDRDDGTILDNMTSLNWVKNMGSAGPSPTVCSKTGGNVSWQEALDHVKCLNLSRYLNFDDWRLPTVEEIESIANYNYGNQDDWLISSGFSLPKFSGTNGKYYYWTSTTQSNSTGSAFVFDNTIGNINVVNKSFRFYGKDINTKFTGCIFSYMTNGWDACDYYCWTQGEIVCGGTDFCGRVRGYCSYSVVWPVRGNMQR